MLNKDQDKKGDKKFNLFNLVSDKLVDPKYAREHTPPIPEEVVNFLGKLSMLDGVPIHNIITTDKYLPKEDINLEDEHGKLVLVNNMPQKIEKGALRLFYIDPEWVECLLNGALSIAADTTDANDTNELLLSRAMDGVYAAQVHYNETKEKIKRQITGLYSPEQFEKQLSDRLFENNLVYGKPDPTPAQSNWLYTGFFIRSSIISTWKGVEVIAKGTYDAQPPVPRRVVKVEKVAADTLFCICEGNITDVEIVQPPETIHFDKKQLGNNPPMRSTAGVLDIAKIVKAQVTQSNDVPSSAEFAKKLLSLPLRSKLTINRNEQL